ncbi:hypothetical protein N0V82_007194 [Gnomoniopsis sp. IMI 355080]|nr:hypothetical protein N0V82_007194 [Gnomoniopsis sp. IMI 355080]
MCLKRRFDTFDDESIASLDILISVKDQSTGGWWHEGCVVLDPEPPRRSSASLSRKEPVNRAIGDLARDARSQGVTLELMFDNASLWQLQSQPTQQDFSHGGDGITLREMLQRSKAARDRICNTARDRISLKDRRYLAVLLARSLLDFSESCWIRKSWSKDDISFLTTDVKRPYLTTDFRTTTSAQGEGPLQPEDSLLVLHPCLPLLDLGILLLEIQEDVGFIDDRVDSDGLVLGEKRESSNFLTAQRMLEELADYVEGGDTSDYVTAVKTCLECNWTPKETEAFSLSNEDFRMWIFEHVVVPLERNLVRGWKVTVMDE